MPLPFSTHDPSASATALIRRDVVRMPSRFVRPRRAPGKIQYSRGGPVHRAAPAAAHMAEEPGTERGPLRSVSRSASNVAGGWVGQPLRPKSLADSSRMATLRILPVTVIGNSSTMCT